MAARHCMLLLLFSTVLSNVYCQELSSAGSNPECTGIISCDENPCNTATCPGEPTAECRMVLDTCGNCHPVFRMNEKDLIASDCAAGSTCVPAPCKPDPCLQASCFLQPSAVCSSDTCKGCVAEFTLDRKVLTVADCSLGSGPVAPCPDGTAPVSCQRNPCNRAVCDTKPTAECRPYQCGGCTARFYVDGERISDSECIGIVPCPADTPQAGCRSEPGVKCMGQTCLAVPEAQCIIDGCGGCNVIFFRAGSRLTEEDCAGCPQRNCEPCDNAICPDHPNARCEPRRCGECRAVFYGADRRRIERCCSAETCEDGSNRFHCKTNPCDGARCLAVPRATCKPDYCGGCKAAFSLPNGTPVQPENCIPHVTCPLGTPLAKCSGDMCERASCPNYPGAVCIIDGCNGCKTIFYNNGKRLTDEDCNGCPKDDRVAGCNDPCDGAVCANHRGARCEVQVCGTCKARFFGENRNEILNCGSTRGCSDGITRYDCQINPCELNSCPGQQNAECRPNYCGGCNAEFYDAATGARYLDHECVEKEICPGDLPVAACGGEVCMGQTCPNYPDARCYVEGCNGCHVTFYSGRRRLTREDCHGCPPGQEKMACPDPCQHALCPLYPDARCEPRVCGKCSAAFYGLDRREIADCCTTDTVPSPPPPPVNCYEPTDNSCTNECGAASCPGRLGSECRYNYCTCEAEFYVDEQMLTKEECLPPSPPVVECPASLCDDAKCPLEPMATCVINEDEDCKVEFFLGSVKLSYEQCEPRACPRCGGDPCKDATCPPHPEAVCRLQDCGCDAEFYLGERKLTFLDCVENMCPSGFPQRNCDPCKNARCPEVSNARCEARRCRTCMAAFFGQGGTEIDLCCDPNERCMDGKRVFHCMKNPCEEASCPADPEAICQPNYCGGCKAEFYSSFDGHKYSDRDCFIFEPCPRNIPQPGCHGINKCLGRTCPNYPNAECLLDACGGCNIVFFDGTKRLTDEDCNGCGVEGPVADCDDPCDGASCPRVPGARCEPQRCGQCRALFYGPNRKLVRNCSGRRGFCPNGLPRFNCSPSPCSVKTCPGVLDATCVDDICGGCKARFYFSSGQEASEFDCAEKEPCPGDLPVAGCAGPEKCLGQTCPNFPDASCSFSGCMLCKVVFYDGAKRLTSEDCNGCPRGQSIVEDCEDPCFNALCPLYPEARCEPRRCGECRAVFFEPAGKEIKSCCGKSDDEPKCPDGESQHQCTMNPCDTATCLSEPSAECVPNYCGGCKAEFFLGDVKLSTEQCEPDLCIVCAAALCVGATCPRYPKAVCRMSRCGCSMAFYLGERKLTGSECEKEDCPETACDDAKCPLERTAICVPNKDEDCKAEFFIGDVKLTDKQCRLISCPRCGRNPCRDATCPAYPGAECRLEICGCGAEFFVGKRKLTDLDCVENPDRCAAYTTCLSAPCRCTGHPDAQCVTQYCQPNQCKVLYFDGRGMKIPSGECDACPPDQPRSACKKNPCDEARCLAFPASLCVPNYCGGCKAEFHYRGSKLSDIQCVKNPDECSLFTTCPNAADLCNCPVVRGAQCVVQYCAPNTCQPLYFDRKGMRLSYEECGLCADGTVPRNCGFVPLCLIASCADHPDAKCRSSNCGTCRTWFEDDKGNKVECEKKAQCKVPTSFTQGVLAPNDRPTVDAGEIILYKCNPGFRMRGSSRRRCIERRGIGRLAGFPPRCFDDRCPRSGNRAVCRSQCNSNAECGFEKMCCWNGCATVCMDQPNECANGAIIAQCFENPCGLATCLRYPEATCKPNYCGGCFQDWFVGNRKLTLDDCGRPADARCPPLNLAIRVCIDQCRGDSDCGILEVCCFNGCGHTCLGY